MILSILFACASAPVAVDPTAPPPSTTVTAPGTPTTPPTVTPPEPVEPDPCIADPECLHVSEAPFRWTFTPEPGGWVQVAFPGMADADYTGDGVADALIAMDDVANTGVIIVAGPLGRDVSLDDAPVLAGVWGAEPVGDLDGDGIGDLLVFAEDYATSGVAFGPFDLTGPTIPWVAGGPPPPQMSLLLDDGPDGAMFGGTTHTGLALYRGPLGADVAPYATVEPPYYDIYQTDSWLHAIPDGRVYLWNETEDVGGCFAIGASPAGAIAPGDADLVDDAACTAVGVPDQNGDGADDIWWGGSVYRSIAADHTPVDLLRAGGEPLARVADVSGDGVEDVVEHVSDTEVALRASGLAEPVIQRFGVGPPWFDARVVYGVLLAPTDGAIAVMPLVP